MRNIYNRLFNSIYYNKNRLVMILLSLLALLTVIPYAFALFLLYLCLLINIRTKDSILDLIQEVKDFIIEPYIFWQENVTKNLKEELWI